MCVTLSLADLSNTRLYAGEARMEDRYVHVIAYQNKAATDGPNAMILPIPAAIMPGSGNVIDTRGFASFLDNIHEATRRKDLPVCFGGGDYDAEVFDVGSYTVVLAERHQAIAQAIASVPTRKRPSVNLAVLRTFDELYPGWPLAVCCWDGKIDAEPLLWWYEPKTPEWLFAPALDAHDGGPPVAGAQVYVDHHIAFGSTLHPLGEEVSYVDQIPLITRGLLPTRVHGTRVVDRMLNGDFWLSTTALGGPALRRDPHAVGPDVQVPLEGWTESDY